MKHDYSAVLSQNHHLKRNSPVLQRNPSIKLYGLPWGYPGWLGSGHWWPFEHANATSLYITKWIKAARTFYNLTIDYVGVSPFSVLFDFY